MQECHQFVRDKLQARGAKPFDFVKTVPCHDPSGSVTNSSFSGEDLQNDCKFFFKPFFLKHHVLHSKSL